MPADEDNTPLDLKKHPNQIKSRKKMLLEAEHVSKTCIKGYYSFIHLGCI